MNAAAVAGSRMHTLLIRTAGVISCIVVAVAISVLYGWQFNVETLKRISPVFVAMNPMTAIDFILASFALLLLISGRRSFYPIAKVFAILVAVTGLLKILSFFSGFNVGIDKWLFPSKLPGEVTGNAANRMAPNTALGFLFLGVVLALPLFDKKKLGNMANYLALMVFVISMFSIVGYIYNLREFYGIMHYIPMALHTAICFLLLSLAVLLANSDKGFMQTFTSPYYGGRIARLLIPFSIIIPVLLGYIRLSTGWRSFHSTEFGVSLLITGIIVIFYFMVWYVAVRFNKVDIARTDAEEKLSVFNAELEALVTERTREIQRNEKKFHDIIDNTRDLIWSVDRELNLVYANNSYADALFFITGKRPVIGEHIVWESFGLENKDKFEAAFAEAFSGKTFIAEDKMMIQGAPYFGETRFTPIYNEHGAIQSVSCVTRDATDRHKAMRRIQMQNDRLKEIAWLQSHKVRSQVTTILGLSQFINKDLIHDPELNKVLDGIQLAAQQLDEVIKEVNRLTKDISYDQ
jgi:PAS domain S-box-containing protein